MKLHQLHENSSLSIISMMVNQLRFLKTDIKKVEVEYKKIAGAKKKQCFNNAFRALGSGDIYVLGYIIVHGVPIEHAWVKKSNGQFIDVTLDDNFEYFSVFEVESELLNSFIDSYHFPPSLFDLNRFVGNNKKKL